MIITLQNVAGFEIDLEWSGPRADDPPVLLLYDGRVFWRHLQKPGLYLETRVDDMSRHTVLARRAPEGETEQPVAVAAPVENYPSTDQDELLEVD